jgi:hypothetical protein
MKKLILIASLFVIATASAQTVQYTKIETTHFKGDKPSSKVIKFEGGTVDIDSKIISIDKEAPKPMFYDIVKVGKPEQEDENYTSVEYLVITTTAKNAIKALKIVAIYDPKHRLADLIVKNGHSNIDYCIRD